MSRTRKLRLVLLATGIAGAVSPVTVSPSGALVPAEACADGTCCAEEKSICFINGVRTDNAYYRGTGPCVDQT